MTIDNIDLEMAFVSSYVAWLSVSRDAIELSQNYRITRDTILQVRDLSEAVGAQFLLVYVPSKEHLYLPHLKDTDIQARVFTDMHTLELNEAGFFQFTNQTATPELVRQYLDDQAGLLADFATENHIRFLDLTSAFQEETGVGVELYYAFDTHWNQRGQDLTAQTIAKYLEAAVPFTVPLLTPQK